MVIWALYLVALGAGGSLLPGVALGTGEGTELRWDTGPHLHPPRLVCPTSLDPQSAPRGLQVLGDMGTVGHTWPEHP